jgi:predicted KAP-like P-loop ATPase
MAISNDAPIEKPAEDLFGLDPFARAIASSIASTSAPSGLVLAINGSWGSGKSSAINLIRHHLAPLVERDELVPVSFNPWWFAGEDALTLAFFQELSIALGPSLPKQIKKSLSSVGRGVSAIGPLLAAAANLKLPGFGGVIGGATGLIGRWTNATRTVESEHEAVAKALAVQTKKFLVIIDDIDRLNPDDALTMFRLVKSVGRLPNVIYLLAFDRALAERAASQKFPSEGASYLEKIVQSAFDVPPPLVDVLRNQLLSAAVEIMGEPGERLAVRFMNVFFDVVAPILKTPRDVVRLVNALRTTWPSVALEVDRADFLAIAALRLYQPVLYRGIRDNPDELCGAQGERAGRDERIKQRYDQMLNIDKFPEGEREPWRRALRRIFPRLDAVWSNTWYSDDGEWQRERRVCSRQHFLTYFAYAISDDVLSTQEIEEFIAKANDEVFVREWIEKNLKRTRRNGSTRIVLLLEELTLRASSIEAASVTPLVAVLFALADEIDVPEDKQRGFAFGDNPLRLHWLLNRLVHDRFDPADRDAIYRKAMATAALAWGCDFAARCYRYFEPSRKEKEYDMPIVSREAAVDFRKLAVEKLRDAAQNGELPMHRRFLGLLFDWSRFSEDGAAEVRRWTDQQLSERAFLIRMAEAMTSVGWVQGLGYDGMGDRVAQKSVHVSTEIYDKILDVEAFETRIREILASSTVDERERDILATYLNAPRRKEAERTLDGADEDADKD